MNVPPRTLAIAAGIAALATGVAYALGHRKGRGREQTLNLARYRNRNLVLLIFSPNATDGRYQRQLRELSGHAVALDTRDVVELHVLASGPGGTVRPGDASLLRTLFTVRRGSFRVVLVGKNGETELDQTQPISAGELIDRIDQLAEGRSLPRNIASHSRT